MDTARQIERWRNGDQRAAEALYADHRTRVFRLAYGLLGNVQDAEEVAQDTLSYALINIARFDADRAQFSTWLHTIAVSRVRDRQRRKRFSLTSLSQWLESGAEPVADAPAPELQRHHGRAIAWRTGSVRWRSAARTLCIRPRWHSAPLLPASR